MPTGTLSAGVTKVQRNVGEKKRRNEIIRQSRLISASLAESLFVNRLLPFRILSSTFEFSQGWYVRKQHQYYPEKNKEIEF